jgi:hypothetical protein
MAWGFLGSVIYIYDLITDFIMVAVRKYISE